MLKRLVIDIATKPGMCFILMNVLFETIPPKITKLSDKAIHSL